jgi:hypothetical protein
MRERERRLTVLFRTHDRKHTRTKYLVWKEAIES